MIAISPGLSRLVRLLVRRSRRATPPISVGVPRFRSKVGSRMSGSILPPVLQRVHRTDRSRISEASRVPWSAAAAYRLRCGRQQGPLSLSAAVVPKPVAETANRLKRPYAERPVNLLPEITDVDLGYVRAVLVAHVPGGVKQLAMSEDLAWTAHESLQKCKLPSGEPKLLIATPDLGRGGIKT